jgi:hypothetical protein
VAAQRATVDAACDESLEVPPCPFDPAAQRAPLKPVVQDTLALDPVSAGTMQADG